MKKSSRIIAAVLVSGIFAAGAFGDGMIVPVNPEIRVRGAWTVKYHHVKITVRDQVASVTIDQEFINTGSGPIEVEYLFPVPPAAAIDSMTMVVNGKEIVARLLKADEARRIYESIVREKKDPALLEYAGFGLYRTRAFPLEPGKPCKIITHYNYICKKDRDLVEVWYPLNTEKFSARPIEDVKVTVDIKSDADITAVYSPTHDLAVKRKGPRHVIATYHAANTLPTIDFQVFYKAANEDIGATLLIHQPDTRKDGYFMMLLSPNPRAAGQKAVPKDVVLVLDHSGSMSGAKLQQATEAVRFVLKTLNPDDRFNVVAYSDTVEAFFDELLDASEQNRQEALDGLDRIDARGATNIHKALGVAMKIFHDRNGAERPGYVIFLTDGRPTVGKRNEKDILAETKKANASGARLFAFGVGYDVNVRLLDKLVRENGGRSDYIKPKEPIASKVSSLYAKIKNPVMTNLKVRIEGLRLRDTYPRELGDLFEGDQIVLVGRFRRQNAQNHSGGEAEAHNTTLLVEGAYQGKERAFEYPVTIRPTGRKTMYSFVERLWAVRRVGWLLDEIQLNGETKELIDELVRLSKQYGIITPYTSFLADETVRLDSPAELQELAEARASRLKKDVVGAAGQVAAKNRQALRSAARAPASTDSHGRVQQIGYDDSASYEAGQAKTVSNVRQVGNQALYRRGKLWVTPETAGLDPVRDAEKISTIERFSAEYFELVRANTVVENRILAGQAAGEELLIKLRGQVYRVR